MFRTPEVVDERCSCGATFRYVGDYPKSNAQRWRENHICPIRMNGGRALQTLKPAPTISRTPTRTPRPHEPEPETSGEA